MVNSGGYEFDESTQVVTLETSHLANLQDLISVSERVTQDPRVPRSVGFLVDLRSMAHLLQFDEIYQVIDWHKARGLPFKGRHAFLVDRPATVGTANIFCTLLQLYSIEADMFDDDQLARVWLSGAPRSSGEFARGDGPGAVTQDPTDIKVTAIAR